MTAPLRGAIAGCGFFGQIHVEGWRRIPEAEIVAACDPDLGKAAAAAPRVFADLEQMLDEVKPDFLDIATRPELHLPMVKIAAARRIPLICQKPMAPTWQECVAMVHAAERAGIPFMIHENWRWQPWFRRAADQARSLGRPITYTFRIRKHDGAGPGAYPAQPYFRQMPRLLIFETLVHHLDTASFLFGDIDSVYARTRRINPAISGEDQALLIVSHRSGVNGVIDGNRFLDLAPDSPPLGDAFFEFEGGAIRLDATGDLYLLRSRRPDELLWKNTVSAGYRGDSVRAASEHFVRCLLSGAPMETSGREYLLTVAAVEAAYRSGESGQAEKLPTREEIRMDLE